MGQEFSRDQQQGKQTRENNKNVLNGSSSHHHP
jgi:uncharacterized protein YwbE